MKCQPQLTHILHFMKTLYRIGAYEKHTSCHRERLTYETRSQKTNDEKN